MFVTTKVILSLMLASFYLHNGKPCKKCKKPLKKNDKTNQNLKVLILISAVGLSGILLYFLLKVDSEKSDLFGEGSKSDKTSLQGINTTGPNFMANSLVKLGDSTVDSSSTGNTIKIIDSSSTGNTIKISELANNLMTSLIEFKYSTVKSENISINNIGELFKLDKIGSLGIKDRGFTPQEQVKFLNADMNQHMKGLLDVTERDLSVRRLCSISIKDKLQTILYHHVPIFNDITERKLDKLESKLFSNPIEVSRETQLEVMKEIGEMISLFERTIYLMLRSMLQLNKIKEETIVTAHDIYDIGKELKNIELLLRQDLRETNPDLNVSWAKRLDFLIDFATRMKMTDVAQKSQLSQEVLVRDLNEWDKLKIQCSSLLKQLTRLKERTAKINLDALITSYSDGLGGIYQYQSIDALSNFHNFFYNLFDTIFDTTKAINFIFFYSDGPIEIDTFTERTAKINLDGPITSYSDRLGGFFYNSFESIKSRYNTIIR